MGQALRLPVFGEHGETGLHALGDIAADDGLPNRDRASTAVVETEYASQQFCTSGADQSGNPKYFAASQIQVDGFRNLFTRQTIQLYYRLMDVMGNDRKQVINVAADH